jgi:hypothetical protein
MSRDLLWWAVDIAFVCLVIWGMFWGTGQTVDAVIIALKGMMVL